MAKKKTEEAGLEYSLAPIDESGRRLGTKEMTAEENAAYVAHAVNALELPVVDIYDEAAVMERTRIYVESCIRTGMRISPPGLANWFGITSSELKEWMLDPGTAEHRRLASRLYEMLRQSWSDYALSGKTPASVAVFLGKNWFGYSDTVQTPFLRSPLFRSSATSSSA